MVKIERGFETGILARDLLHEPPYVIHDLDHVCVFFPLDGENKGILLVYEGQSPGFFQGWGYSGNITEIDCATINALERNIPEIFWVFWFAHHPYCGLVVPHFHCAAG